MTFERYPELDTLLLANPGAVRDYKPEGVGIAIWWAAKCSPHC